jgi:hypothetical protein
VAAVTAYDAVARVYNLNIKTAHTYYVLAGSTPLLVHNCGGLKRGPKPFGVGAHNVKIAEVADQVSDGAVVAGGQRLGLPEAVIKTENGFKGSRRPDILVERANGSRYGINVGKQAATGAPIKREAQAIQDLEGAGLEMHFVPYN